MTVDTNKYLDFVTGVTSLPSTDLAALLARLTALDVEVDADVPRVITTQHIDLALSFSKKLKEHNDAIFKTKGDGYIFYIKKLN